MKHDLLAKVRFVAILLLSLVAALPAARTLQAQSAGTGSLTGTVTDASGAVVPGVAVTASSTGTGQAYTTNTGGDGV